jgi:hypothetical protein
MLQMSETSNARLQAAHEASEARFAASAARTDAILAHLLAASPIASPPSPVSSEIAALTEMGRNMTQMSLLSVGKSRAGASTAVSLFLTALTPLVPLFNDFNHLTKLICPGESFGVGVASSLSSTPDLLALSNLVNLDNFKKKVLEIAYPYDDDDSALRSLNSDSLIGLATLNFAKAHDKCISILAFQKVPPSKSSTVTSVNAIILCCNIRRTPGRPPSSTSRKRLLYLRAIFVIPVPRSASYCH